MHQKRIVANQRTASGAIVDLYESQPTPSVRKYSLVRRSSAADAIALDVVLLAFAIVLVFPRITSMIAMTAATTDSERPSLIDASTAVVVSKNTTLHPSPGKNVRTVDVAGVTAAVLLLICVVRGVLRSRSIQVEEITAIQGLGLQRSVIRTPPVWTHITSFFRSLFTSVAVPPKSPASASPTSQSSPDAWATSPTVAPQGWGPSEPRGSMIDIGTIEAVVIHEGYFRHSVEFYLAVVVRDSPTVAVLFDETLPRLSVLRPVLLGLRAVLFQEPETGLSLSEMSQRGIPPIQATPAQTLDVPPQPFPPSIAQGDSVAATTS